jgi:hypothetical protein
MGDLDPAAWVLGETGMVRCRTPSAGEEVEQLADGGLLDGRPGSRRRPWIW